MFFLLKKNELRYKCIMKTHHIHENGETQIEEYLNSLTSLVGFIFGLVGWPVLLYMAYQTHSNWYIFSCAVYGATLVLMYGVSSFYHGSKVAHHKRLLRILDHSCIFLLIAGSYTPYTLGPLREGVGFTLFVLIWSIAFAGVAIKVFSLRLHDAVSVLLYLSMGWMIVLIFPTIINVLPFSVFLWLMIGGVSYSLGTIFYLWQSLPFNHCIWHLFVLGGSISHFFSVFEMVKFAATS